MLRGSQIPGCEIEKLFFCLGGNQRGTPNVKLSACILERIECIPSQIGIAGTYPNPFNSSTTIEYSLPEDGQVILVIYNISGQAVKVLSDAYHLAGKYAVTWNAADMPSGLYFCTLKTKNHTQTSKMLLLK